MLKRKLNKEQFDALDEGQKSLYKENTSRAGEFLLDVEVDADNAALVRSKTIEKTRADTAEAKVTELTLELEGLNTQIATLNTNRPDTAALEKQYKDREAALKTKHEGELVKKDKLLATVLVDQKALEIATKISSTPELLVEVIKKRLKASVSDGEPTTEILDAAGLASTATIQDLEQEFVANPKYAAIIIGSNASGGGARPSGGGSGATYKGKKFSDLTEVERVAWHKEDAKGFQAASDANRNPAT